MYEIRYREKFVIQTFVPNKHTNAYTKRLFMVAEVDSTLYVWKYPGKRERLNFAALIIVERTMTNAIYEENIIEPIIVPLHNEFWGNFIHQDENNSPRRKRRVKNILRKNDTLKMNWPAKSPDINPIEHE